MMALASPGTFSRMADQRRLRRQIHREGDRDQHRDPVHGTQARQDTDHGADERADHGHQDVRQRKGNAKADRQMIKNAAHIRTSSSPPGRTTSSTLSNSTKKKRLMTTPPIAHFTQPPPNRRPTNTVINDVAITKPSHWNRKA
ncbi:hypothetical protein G6F22_018469 [Rhizopus arrhizus]|nr:hypothetical protein G6F22_018469 [Rhizopus arrhizus]